MPTPIDYIEFTVSDLECSRAIYGSVFSWAFKDYGEEYCEFTDRHMKGGFAKGQGSSYGGPLIVLYSKALLPIREKLEELGAVITKPVFSFPGGKRFHFRDLDGYELAVWSDE